MVADQMATALSIFKRGREVNIPFPDRTVRALAVMAEHAVWHLRESWIVQLKSRDSLARRRFTLYHEIFQILARNKSNPCVKTSLHTACGPFLEILADHFSTCLLVPEDILVRK